MALFHLHMKPMGKTEKSGNIKNIAAAVAYRHCFKFDDFNYSNKKGFVDSFLMIPQDIMDKVLEEGKIWDFLSKEPEFKAEFKEKLKAKLEAGDVKSLWNTIQAQETRKDAQYCMEMQISLQHELSLEENIKNLKTLIHNHYISKGLCADVVLHNPDNNLHAHVMITQRQLDSISFDIFKEDLSLKYKFNDKKLRDETFGRPSDQQLEPIRAEWANLCNASFEAAGLSARISHKTLEAQRQEALEAGNFVKAAELDRKPVKHIYRNESIQAQAEREVAAEKAEIHNQKEEERYKLQLELVEMNMMKPEDVVKPEFKPVLRTFEDSLMFRAQEKIRIIEENVARYIKDRAVKYARQLGKARARAEETIASVRLAIRNGQQRMVAKIIGADDEITKGNDRRVNHYIREQQEELGNSEQNKLKNLANKAIRILNANKDKEKIAEILNMVNETAVNKPELAHSPEFKPLLDCVETYKKNLVIEEKIDKNIQYWNNPFFIPIPTYKPSWITKLGDGTGTSSSS